MGGSSVCVVASSTSLRTPGSLSLNSEPGGSTVGGILGLQELFYLSQFCEKKLFHSSFKILRNAKVENKQCDQRLTSNDNIAGNGR